MSFAILWHDDGRAFIASDGLLRDEDGNAIAVNRPKFFHTAGGAIIGVCGFLRCCERARAKFTASNDGFTALVGHLSEFVAEANRANAPTAFSKPLAAFAVSRQDGLIRSVGIGVDGVVSHSVAGMNAVRFLSASNPDNDFLKKAACGLALSLSAPSSKGLRQFVSEVLDCYPGIMGGEIFEASLEPDGFMGMNAVANVLAAGDNAAFGYVSTSTSIGIYNSAGTWPRPDGTNGSFGTTGSSGSPAWIFDGLSASTTYHFGGYVDVSDGSVHVVMSDNQTSAGSIAWFVQTLFADGHAVLFTDWTISTPPSGSGGGGGSPGGGGATCPAEDQEIETSEHGFIAARNLAAGMHVRGWAGEWNRIEATRIVEGLLHHITIAGERFHVDVDHRWLPVDVSPDAPIGQWRRSADSKPGELVQSAEGEPVSVEQVSEPHAGRFVELVAERQRFRLGRIIAHNFLTL